MDKVIVTEGLGADSLDHCLSNYEGRRTTKVVLRALRTYR